MSKTKLEKMEELDAKIEKINYDLSNLEIRKKELEEKKFNEQQEKDKLENDKKLLLSKTDNMRKFQKFVYITFKLRNDLKQIELLNAKIIESQEEKDNIQKKIDIQNNLYAETIREKDNYIEERKRLYVEQISTKDKEKITEESRSIKIDDLNKVYNIASKYKENPMMNEIMKILEKQVHQNLSIKQNAEESQME